MSKELKITAVERIGEMEDIGAAAAKALPPGRRYRYRQPLQYALEDGTKISGQSTAMSKPKLEESIKDKERYISNGMMNARHYSDGGGWSIVVSFGIGAGAK